MLFMLPNFILSEHPICASFWGCLETDPRLIPCPILVFLGVYLLKGASDTSDIRSNQCGQNHSTTFPANMGFQKINFGPGMLQNGSF